MNRTKEIVVISGKGGTGKTSITASFAYLGGSEVVVTDCDVDAADMHLLLQPDFKVSEDFYSGWIAEINQDECAQCGECADVCRFDAIPVIEGKYTVEPLSCEGCGYCALVCPAKAIEMKEANVGMWFVSDTKLKSLMVHAKLNIGSDNSGKLVTKIKNEAKSIAESEGKKIVLVDGSPGIGCPVVSSITGADFVVLVTEPTVSGIHDLKRVYEIVKKFNIPAGCIINKYDINPKINTSIIEFLQKENILYLSGLPYDETFTKAMTNGKTIVEYSNDYLKEKIEASWDKVLIELNKR